jgi:hypothetical protein
VASWSSETSPSSSEPIRSVTRKARHCDPNLWQGGRLVLMSGTKLMVQGPLPFGKRICIFVNEFTKSKFQRFSDHS